MVRTERRAKYETDNLLPGPRFRRSESDVGFYSEAELRQQRGQRDRLSLCQLLRYEGWRPGGHEIVELSDGEVGASEDVGRHALEPLDRGATICL